MIRPQVRARPQVRRDHPRRRPREGFADGDTIPLDGRDARAGRVRRVHRTCSTTRRARRCGRTSSGFGTALAGRGVSINQAIGAFRPLLRDIVPVAAQPVRPATRASSGFIASSADAAAEVAPVGRDAGASCSSNLDRTFAALREVARPFIQESIAEGPADARRGDPRRFPSQRPFLRQHARAVRASCGPGVRALRDRRARSSPTRCEVGTPTLRALASRSTAASSRCCASLQRFAEDPLVPRGVERPDRRRDARCARRSQFLAPAQTQCNYVDAAGSATSSSLLSEGDANGTWQRFIIIATPQGPNNEGGPSSAPADGPTRENHLHANPYPNTAVARPAQGVRGRQRAATRAARP